MQENEKNKTSAFNLAKLFQLLGVAAAHAPWGTLLLSSAPYKPPTYKLQTDSKIMKVSAEKYE